MIVQVMRWWTGLTVPLLPEDKLTLYASNDNVVQDTWCIEPGLSGHNGMGQREEAMGQDKAYAFVGCPYSLNNPPLKLKI